MSDQELVSAIVADLSDSERLRLLAFFGSPKVEAYQATLARKPISGGGLKPDKPLKSVSAVAGR